MAKQRTINVCIWDDPDFQEYTPHEKLIFVHLITNKSVTESGVYSYTFKTISDNTGIRKKDVSKILNDSMVKNVLYDHKHHIIWVKNRLKYNKGGNPRVILRSILNDYKSMKRSFIWDDFWVYNKIFIEDLISKSDNLKYDISDHKIILPKQLTDSSLTIK